MPRLFPYLCLLPWAVVGHGQPTAEPLSQGQAQALVSRVLATEIEIAQGANHPMRYLLRKSTPRLTSTKDIIETKDGDVARLLSINDQPLSQADEQREASRLEALASNPSLQKHRKQGEDADFGLVLKLLRMLPNAFLYQYAGTGSGPAGLVQKFTFRPNPKFDPPDYETQALTALSGELWIDAEAERVTRLEGHLQQDTVYGWGILGRLNKGGWVVIEQSDVGDKQWRILHVQMEMTLRIVFKSRNIDTVEQFTRYSPVPVGMDYRQAIQMLRAGSGAAIQAGR